MEHNGVTFVPTSSLATKNNAVHQTTSSDGADDGIWGHSAQLFLELVHHRRVTIPDSRIIERRDVNTIGIKVIMVLEPF